jgi:predicted lipoprotein with Yx(FWY)xxD motif
MSTALRRAGEDDQHPWASKSEMNMQNVQAAVISATLAALCAIAGCSDDDDDSGGAGATGGVAGKTTGGFSGAHAGTTQGGTTSQGGTASQGGSLSLAGTAPIANAAGAGGDAAGAAGGGSPSAGESAGGAGGVGGGGGEGGALPANLTVDAAAKTLLATDGALVTTLYFFGRDVPASPTTNAVSACTDACTETWPVFYEPSVVVGPGLSDADFSELVRPDGLHQTTFKGWPLYAYSGDATPGARTGDGLNQLWHAVEQPFYSLVVMRGEVAGEDSGLYVADGAGHTIYRFLGDEAGTANADPVSTCTTSGCRKAWPVVTPTLVKPVSSIDGALDTFIRPDTGEVQLAYRGLPTYYFAQDLLPGDLKGVGKPSWTLLVP